MLYSDICVALFSASEKSHCATVVYVTELLTICSQHSWIAAEVGTVLFGYYIAT